MITASQLRAARPNILRWTLIACIPLAAAAIAYFATRGQTEPSLSADHSRHGQGDAGDVAKPVMLTPDDERRIGITFDVATVMRLAREIRTVGQVTYDETRVKVVSLKVDGWVQELYVNFTGQPVTAAAPLLSIYSPALVMAQEELLLATRLMTDVRDADSTARANAASLLSSARRRLGYWDIPTIDIRRIEDSREVQRALVMRSPVNGFVLEKNVLPGQRVMAGDELYRIADLSSVWVEGEVFERDLAAVRQGQRVRVELDALPGSVRNGRIAYVYPTLRAETRTSRVRIELSNPDMRLKPGMYATLVWNGSEKAVLSVPRTAVISTGQRHLVFVRRPDGMLEPRIVQVGTFGAERVEVLSGLAAGETVVKSATFLLDAESNLGTLLGGMGNMPGMDMTLPTAPAQPGPQTTKRSGGPDGHASH